MARFRGSRSGEQVAAGVKPDPHCLQVVLQKLVEDERLVLTQLDGVIQKLPDPVTQDLVDLALQPRIALGLVGKEHARFCCRKLSMSSMKCRM